MIKTGLTIREAAEEWVDRFNAIPYAVVEKLAKLDIDSIHEITPPSKHDRVYITDGMCQGEEGEILRVSDDDDEVYVVELDGSGEEVEISQDDFEVQNDGFLPMWGTMWTFGDGCDNWWLEEKAGLQAMADCGFRIYESEDFEYIFGIDGAGYDFYEAHWVPLYRARGLQWHDPEVDKEVSRDARLL